MSSLYKINDEIVEAKQITDTESLVSISVWLDAHNVGNIVHVKHLGLGIINDGNKNILNCGESHWVIKGNDGQFYVCDDRLFKYLFSKV